MAYTEENNYSNNFLQHAVQLSPIAFAGIAIQGVRLHWLHPHFSIRENLVHSLSQFCQDNLSGPFESLNITLVINQFNEHKSLRETAVIVYSVFFVKINSVKASGARKVEGFLLPLVTNRKTPDRKIWGSFKVHVHFTCIFLSFLGLRAVWSVSVGDCFYCRCPVAVLLKVVELAGVEPAAGMKNIEHKLLFQNCLSHRSQTINLNVYFRNNFFRFQSLVRLHKISNLHHLMCTNF